MKRRWYIVALLAVLLVGCPRIGEWPAGPSEAALRNAWSGRGQIKDIRLPCLRRECRP